LPEARSHRQQDLGPPTGKNRARTGLKTILGDEAGMSPAQGKALKIQLREDQL